ncbi:MAG: 50S ribosomal protein L5 [Candidatus Abyssobacteria bacterium SURF_17]|jgi:large subunit ribosomal protein L5|uniref:Large ribosomal subunit protein uL5 n=1 Tax=Candidatus Abyssobacteria bacterium SURF_17 TaxID=2093361 RepID=A0A419EVN3_9BACT|nr:MAG: 50S ribosomal protein L5 [Candidatus Abyssubacteria bacterium SURF_17]
MARLKEKYRKEVVPALKERLGLSNVMEVPRLSKIVVNMGLGDAPSDAKVMESAMKELAKITGQKPVVRRAKKSIASFKLRAGAAIGCMVTLRGDRMYEFFDRLVNVAIPRIRDFRGVSRNAFDRFGNFTLGIKEQIIFPEIDYDDVYKIRGMNVVFVIQNSNGREASLELLKELGMPFGMS